MKLRPCPDLRRWVGARGSGDNRQERREMVKIRHAKFPVWLALFGGLGLWGADVAAKNVGGAIEEAVKQNAAAARAQKKIDRLDDRTGEMLGEYRGLVERLESLRLYNRQLSTLIEAQQRDMESVRQQGTDVTLVGRELTPFMLRMLDSLEEFVKLDVPFLLSERGERVAGLRAMMDRADVTNAEKLRRIFEALQIENEYGRTLETYRGDLLADGVTRTVDYLRVGRSVLVYQTLDGKNAGVWEAASKKFTPLSGEYRSAIAKGLRIARRQAPPDLIRLPVSGAVEVEG